MKPDAPNPDGLCMCGCGERTSLATKNDASTHRVKGQPMRYVNGHGTRSPCLYVESDPGHQTPCWLWQGPVNHGGYGTWNEPITRRPNGAHRIFYEQRFGPIPDGLQIDHLCRVRRCVNPDHLEPVTPAENQRRSANSRLTWADATAMRLSRLTTTLSQQQIADMFGSTRTTVQGIVEGKRWVLPS